MRLKQLLQNIREPPADSAVAYMSHAGGKSMRSMPFVSLINIVWLFLWAILQRQSFMRVILPTRVGRITLMNDCRCRMAHRNSHTMLIRLTKGMLRMDLPPACDM